LILKRVNLKPKKNQGGSQLSSAEKNYFRRNVNGKNKNARAVGANKRRH